jgi:hypothetical protein
MLCPPGIFMEKPYVFVLSYNLFAWFLVLNADMVDDTRQYELLSVEHNCRTIKGFDHSNSIFCKTLHLLDFQDELYLLDSIVQASIFFGQ